MAYQTVQSKFTASGGGEIHLGVTLKPITAWGGIAVFAAFCETVGLRGALDRVLVWCPRNTRIISHSDGTRYWRSSSVGACAN